MTVAPPHLYPGSETPADPYTDPDFEHDDDGFEDDEDGWAEMMCSQHADGQCSQAGSEYCEFECPFRDEALP